ncbi:MAG: hypothetical protein HC828_10080 [Blastochloris sp.]|nr:hypothetical protein [Blastochloris sp.]
MITLYGSVVRVANDSETFCDFVGDALREDNTLRREKEQSLLAQNTWDSIVARMQKLIEKRVSRRTA